MDVCFTAKPIAGQSQTLVMRLLLNLVNVPMNLVDVYQTFTRNVGANATKMALQHIANTC